MKKWLVMFLVVWMLCGCEMPLEPETESATLPEGTVAVTEPTVPSGLYCPESELETATGGALRVFPLGLENARGIRFLGDDILVFSGKDHTALTLLSGEDRYIAEQVMLTPSLSPESPSVLVREQGVTYYDASQQMLVSLDAHLAETARLPLPEHIPGSFAIAPDCSVLYYCTENALRILDPETQTDRLLTEMDFCRQELKALHCNGSILECAVTDEQGCQSTRFISSDGGSLLREVPGNLVLRTDGDFYFAIYPDGNHLQLLSGSGHYGPSVLVTEHRNPRILPVTGAPGLILASGDGQSTTLDYYDLESGSHPYQLQIPDMILPESILADKAGKLWFLDRNNLYCWDPEKAPTTDSAIYLQSLFTPEHPDLEGIRHCRELADAISDEYYVQILLWTDATAFPSPDHRLIPEHQVPLIRESLNRLETALSQYPQDFLKKAAVQTPEGRVRICLVRSIEDRFTGIPETQYWDDHANAWIALASGDDLEQALHRALFPIIESRVLACSKAWDDWQKLNPQGFEYGISNQDLTLTEGDHRAFIDPDSMDSPRNDRGTVMEYAMTDAGKDCFSSPVMQLKLQALCLGIREAFALESDSAPLFWEQYLEVPIQKSP